jgi:hypothetical protein
VRTKEARVDHRTLDAMSTLPNRLFGKSYEYRLGQRGWGQVDFDIDRNGFDPFEGIGFEFGEHSTVLPILSLAVPASAGIDGHIPGPNSAGKHLPFGYCVAHRAVRADSMNASAQSESYLLRVDSQTTIRATLS